MLSAMGTEVSHKVQSPVITARTKTLQQPVAYKKMAKVTSSLERLQTEPKKKREGITRVGCSFPGVGAEGPH